ncbi:MAG: hypothetical protein L6408_06230 [Nanoarchaeota archaeon]|nr:hypothetical protein [Nanoarchaeota archaeon]
MIKKEERRMSWWKKIILIAFGSIILLSILLFLIAPRGFITNTKSITEKNYYIKNGLCYADFLENCVMERVAVTGKIVKGPCPKFETEAYVLCNTNVPPCDWQTYLSPYASREGYEHCIALVYPCNFENAAGKINSKVEQFLSNPLDKTVKVTGRVFVVSIEKNGIVGISPESITIIESESK